jgi:hypothetical protein
MQYHRASSVSTVPVCLVLVSALGLIACDSGTTTQAPAPPPPVASTDEAESAVAAPMDRVALFGDLHVHTQLSFDAYIFGTRSDPDSAYRFAKGEGIQHPAGFEMKLREPLDFQAVTDHAMYLGMVRAIFDPESTPGQHPIGASLRNATTAAERLEAFNAMFPYLRRPDAFGLPEGAEPFVDDLLDMGIVRSAWQEVVDGAERHNKPGEFTTFIAYEYTTAGELRENLHRNVIFRGSEAPDAPFSSIDSRNPEDLWSWMDGLRAEGIEAIAIPHNSNGSDGMMFETTNWAGEPIDAAYAEQRMRNEPVVEITQVKGTSETHPMLSPNDEWAGFELMEVKVATDIESKPPGSYVRDAYRRGLVMEEASGFNPYKFGIVGASDTHVGAGAFEESDYWSKIGVVDATGKLRGSVPLDEPTDAGDRYNPVVYSAWGASGLTGVWAEENTRDAIYDAFRRKETFGTSGPRMRVRFFAGYGWDDAMAEAVDVVASAYESGVPMGSDLAARGGTAPNFLVWATRDPESAALQRVQVIKVWIADGESQERVFDVACSDGLSVDPETQRCPDNGASVRLEDCSISADLGADELRTMWSDPDFDATQRASYYVRALENPTCRWSTFDALRAGVAPRADLQPTLQERAWSSPIWYLP